MDTETDNFRDLPELLNELAQDNPLTDGAAIVALVRDPQGPQQVIHTELLRASAYLEDYMDARDEIYDLMNRMPMTDDDERELRCRPLTVLVRRGFTVFTTWESEWTLAWRYSNHPRHTLTSDFVLVTEHGWNDLMSGDGGLEPALTFY